MPMELLPLYTCSMRLTLQSYRLLSAFYCLNERKHCWQRSLHALCPFLYFAAAREVPQNPHFCFTGVGGTWSVRVATVELLWTLSWSSSFSALALPLPMPWPLPLPSPLPLTSH